MSTAHSFQFTSHYHLNDAESSHLTVTKNQAHERRSNPLFGFLIQLVLRGLFAALDRHCDSGRACVRSGDGILYSRCWIFGERMEGGSLDLDASRGCLWRKFTSCDHLVSSRRCCGRIHCTQIPKVAHQENQMPHEQRLDKPRQPPCFDHFNLKPVIDLRLCMAGVHALIVARNDPNHNSSPEPRDAAFRCGGESA